MKKPDPEKNPNVPSQKEGKMTGAEAEVECKSEGEAKLFFKECKRRLLEINRWDKISGELSAKFYLCDGSGKEVERDPKEGDFIKIDLPGPGPTIGDGFDWVRIEKIEEVNNPDDESLSLRTRPSPMPGTDDAEVAHFYTDRASSTFVLSRKGIVVAAAEKGRNEVVNNKETNLADTVRNTVVGVTASHGASVPQWKALARGILGK